MPMQQPGKVSTTMLVSNTFSGCNSFRVSTANRRRIGNAEKFVRQLLYGTSCAEGWAHGLYELEAPSF